MRYPNGSTIRVGDLVWWDEGHCVGYVQVVAESKEAYESWGLGGPHIFLSNEHPFNPSQTLGVAHSEACLKDEGIGLLTPEERTELQQAEAKARMKVNADFGKSVCSVITEVQNGKRTGWVFTFLKDGDDVDRVRIFVGAKTTG